MKKDFNEMVKILQEHDKKISGLEDWIVEFLEDLGDNFNDISSLVFNMIQAVKEVKFGKSDFDFVSKEEDKEYLPLFRKYIEDTKDGWTLEKLKKLEKLNDFFDKYDI